MRVLILGGAGMLGHKLWQEYRERFDTWATVRSNYNEYARYGLFDPQRLLGEVDAFNFESIARAFASVQPDVVINCVGIIKQLTAAHDPIQSITVNALLPHRLAELCRAAESRLIHISTDCVFSGRKGMYVEEDSSDAEDLYGRTKFLGEVSGSGCLTLRTSIIGRELKNSNGLVEWFLANRGGIIRGYSRVIYTGFTTAALARIVADVIEHHPDLAGVYHVSSDPISKLDLLCLMRDLLDIQMGIEDDPSPRIDRSLDSSRFRAAAGTIPPSWGEMISELTTEMELYERWRAC